MRNEPVADDRSSNSAFGVTLLDAGRRLSRDRSRDQVRRHVHRSHLRGLPAVRVRRPARGPHVAQYGLIGLSLCVFYLLLLSLAEQIGFGLAYLASALGRRRPRQPSTTGLCSAAAGPALAFGAILAGLYGGLYGLLQLEDVALLTGSLLLFAVLSLAMWLTRNIHAVPTGIEDLKRRGRPTGRPLAFTGPAGMMPRRSGESMRLPLLVSPARLRGRARLRPGAGQRLQLVRLYRRGPAQGLREGHRHQGQLHDLRFQRDPRSQAARRPLGLRRGGADRLAVLRAPARRQASTSRSTRPSSRTWKNLDPEIMARARQVRSRQRPCHPLDVGHDRHRLQRRQPSRSAWPTRRSIR